jgi:glycosyltransferase involved in cell wall biosynthesis
MRILHVGHGFRPWRPGGLVAYIESLLDAQVARGYDVSYFLSGRHYPMRRRVRRYRRRGVETYELQGFKPLFGEDAGTVEPARDLSEAAVEACFRRALHEQRPQVVSVLDLGGLPSSLIDVAHQYGAPVVMTVHDYLPLCPTVKLYDAHGRNCVRSRVGSECAVCCSGAPRGPGHLVEKTVEYEVMRVAARVPGGRRAALAVGGALRRARAPAAPAAEPANPDAYQRRRDVNVERLNRVDALIACSNRVAELYDAHGVRGVRAIHGTVAHLEGLRPRVVEPGAPLHFATLNGFASRQKGAHVLIEALRRLDGRPLRLSAFGHVDPRLREPLAALGVEVRGAYDPSQLDAVLADVDVGVLPSVYEEPYAYSGLEFLAKGIPLVANALGGSPEYTVDGETGWLNRTNDGDGLARIMAAAADDPRQVAALSARIVAARDRIVKPIGRHLDELEEVYRACSSR